MRNRHRHGQVRLPRSGRPDPENDIVLPDRINIRLLRQALWCNHLVPRRDQNRIQKDILQIRL